MNYYFIGICGIGMSGLACVLNNGQNLIIGSDRYFDNNENIDIKEKLLNSNIIIVKQNDNVFVKYKIDRVVVSSAVDSKSKDIIDAQRLKIKIMHRSELLSEIVKSYKHSISIAGTSGKSSITAITGYIFYTAEKAPAIINGAFMHNFKNNNLPGNAIVGKNDFIIFESDESDGSFLNYSPETAIISNISLDHKNIDELKILFKKFSYKVKTNLIINNDCQILNKLKFRKNKIYRISLKSELKNISNLKLNKLNIRFDYKGLAVNFKFPGIYNLYNILMSIKSAELYKIKKEHIVSALNNYKGLFRRFDIKLKTKKYIVLDDYAHNPDKIKNLILTLQHIKNYRYLIFQPHGYGPTALMFDEYVNVFKNNMTEKDWLFLLPVYFAGGSVDKIKDSNDIYKILKESNKNLFYFEDRKELKKYLLKNIKENSVVAVFGARDNSLNDFAADIAAGIKNK